MYNFIINLKLKTKIFLLVFTAVLALFVTELISRQRMIRQYEIKITEKDVEISNIYENYLESVFDEIKNTAYSMLEDRELQNNLLFVQKNKGKKGYSEALRRSDELLRNYYLRNSYFDTMIIATEEYLFRYGSKTQFIKDFSQYREAVAGKNGETQIITEENRVVLAKEFRLMTDKGLVHTASMAVLINFDGIINNLKKSLPIETNDFGLNIYQDEICLYSNRPVPEAFLDAEDGWYIDGEELITVYTMETLGYTVIINNYYGDVLKEIKSIYISSGIRLLLIAGILLCFGFLTSNYITMDLSKLLSLIDGFGKGKLPDEIEKYEDRKDETGKLLRHFYRMAYDYQKITKEHYESEMLRKEIEFAYLQKQIQPHFLYNTLTVLSWMAYEDENAETAHGIETLAKMMRSITDDQKPMVTVNQELTLVEEYLSLTKLRVGERLEVKIMVSDRTRELMLPKLTLQPLVENCIVHGLNQTISQFHIQIYDVCEGDMTDIIIEDSGEGFAEDILDKIEKDRIHPKQREKGSGIALQNIHFRLQHIFSKECGLSFQHLEHGMQVRVRIKNRNQKETFQLQ